MRESHGLLFETRFKIKGKGDGVSNTMLYLVGAGIQKQHSKTNLPEFHLQEQLLQEFPVGDEKTDQVADQSTQWNAVRRMWQTSRYLTS